MGPSGQRARTTLLHSLWRPVPLEPAGCLKNLAATGRVAQDAERIRLRHRQEDVFFSISLTCARCCSFTGRSSTRLRRFIDTRIGDFLDKGLSGG
uniref:Secreted protein n=1 Tax=Macrostomum lignano TaxID=282301 RepID=A0A1I8FBZ1_9PLAT